MKLSGRSTSLGGLGLQRQRHLCVGNDIADIPVVVDETDLAAAPLVPHYVARLRIGAVFEHREHLPTLEPMSSPSMADAMRRAPQATKHQVPSRRPTPIRVITPAVTCAGSVADFGAAW